MYCHCHTECSCRKQSLWTRVLDAIAETIDETARKHERARQFKEGTLEKYKGTRVVTIALRTYTNFWGGKSKKSFWYAHEDTWERVLDFAEREWKNDPDSWGPLYWLVSLVQLLTSPILWLARGLHRSAYYLEERRMIPRRWNSMNAQKRRYRVINALERNWNQTVFRPDSN